MGIAYKPETNGIRLYAPFAECDLILCSPLGLKFALQDKSSFKSKGQLTDTLSSVEHIYLAESNLISFQNLDFVDEVLSLVNLLPKNNNSIKDINRLSPVFQDNKVKESRQNIMVSSFKSKALESVFLKHCCNVLGFTRMAEEEKGLLAEIPANVKIEFKLVEPTGELNVFDSKFLFFTKTVVF